MDAAENAFVMGSPLWTHADPTQTRLWEFKTHIEQKYGENFTDYEALRQWSIKNIGPLWSEVWHFTGVVASEPFTEVRALQFLSLMSIVSDSTMRRCRSLLKMLLCSLVQLSFKAPS